MRLGIAADLGRLDRDCRDRCLAGAVPAFHARRGPPDRGQNVSATPRLRRAAEVWVLAFRADREATSVTRGRKCASPVHASLTSRFHPPSSAPPFRFALRRTHELSCPQLFASSMSTPTACCI